MRGRAAPDVLQGPEVGDIELLELLKALADPARLYLLGRLSDGRWHRLGDYLPELQVHKSTLSHHLKVLREAGITATRVVGRDRETCLRRDDLELRFPGLLPALAAGARGAIRPDQDPDGRAVVTTPSGATGSPTGDTAGAAGADDRARIS
ncbi:ArsR/SmtB family transcription factor [Nakamurella leprariae]|uniref:Helix-turn-helix transcriptional regulator n=1 Tax=Nakamurella leprariae TaxID=2803911 RepID=A0A938YAS3_9ACTN|nr:helix-turn-helix transcriptional regulator [Nakamurella leprariae]MBM9466354.1 helix-turn-helix transcriptional regulator [Nakamurella leprariae]